MTRTRMVSLIVGVVLAALVAGDVLRSVQLSSVNQQQKDTQQQLAQVSAALNGASGQVTTVDQDQASNAQKILNGLAEVNVEFQR